MEKILARRFAPFDFSAIPGFPNVVPSPNEWGDYLPRFGKCEGDNPAQHLSEFHELMRQWEIHHEDVLLKMFMFSLAGDARKWYHSLPPASISSLSEFHAAFTAYCQELYPSELIFHSCCEGYYNKCIQDRAVSYVGYEDDPNDLDQNAVISPPHSSVSGEVMELVKSITARLDRWEAERCTEDFGISAMDDYEDPEEEEDASGEVMELIKSITARLDRWEAEQCAEDFPSFEAEALSSSTEGDYEKSFPTGPVYGHYESDPWESQEEEILPDMIMSDEGCDDGGCKDRRLGEEYALSELIEQAKSLTAQHARLESEGNGENFPVFKADDLSSSFEEIIEDFWDASASAPDELAVSDQNDEEVVVEEDCSLFLHKISHDVFTFGVETEERGIVPFLQVGEALFPPPPPDFDDYLEEEQQNPTSPFAYQSSQTTYDSYESESELDMLDFQEQVAEPCPLLTKENYHEEISHLSLSGDAEQYKEEQNLPGEAVYDEYESDPGESQEEEEKEPEEQSEHIFHSRASQ
jgi:hypothetical protein